MDRVYRTEFIRERTGRTVYADGAPVAAGPVDMSAEQARVWANGRLGEGMVWLSGWVDPAETWYLVA
ncbi:hypothetical protein V5P93_003915 [Actinokineospora auranticolor]|uniref:Uncharacterized protein n=1 Tax=Actinokineospora auranticolor TaxID=155976 RepID=A0A2S6GM04_9PSEU|nr:hypothetical protein [Actinokineospora auranticolor]PPK66196.1 hypothetical protein CLV40_111160 [Actinokineospora auranticolor]